MTFLILLATGCKDGILLEDWREPELVLRTPAAGEHTTGETVRVTGVARHLDEVEVNGIPADVSMWGGFEVEVPVDNGMTVIEAVGFRDDGEIRFERHAIISGRFGDPDQPVEQAIVARVNQGALDFAMLLAQDAINPDEITRQAMAMNPVMNEDGWLMTVKAVIDTVSFQQPKLRATPTVDNLLIELRIPAFHVAVSSWGQILGNPFDVWVSVGADEIKITPGLGMGSDGERLKLTVESFDIELIGFSFDTSLLPGEIEDMLLVDSVVEKMESALETAAQELLAPVVETALDGLDLSFETQISGRALTGELAFSDAFVDTDGIQLAMDMETHMPASVTSRAPGYLLSEGGSPSPSTKADLSVAISDDFVNALFFQMWQAGLLDIELSTEDGTLDPELLTRLKAEEGTIRARAELPPLIGQERGRLQIQVGELAVDLDTPGGELGDHLELAVDLQIDAAPTTYEGVLDLGLGEPTIDMMVRDNDWGATEESTTNLIEAMLPLDSLVGVLGGVEIPLPSIDGTTPIDIKILRDDSGAHTMVGLDLD
ncbi:MAG TPA: hypothetical protein QGF58_24995 [Myxococcota bacterium]|nr:hypothetical protein [Myxococcota bacterium]